MNEDVAEEIAAVERLYAEVMGDQHPATLSMRRESGETLTFTSITCDSSSQQNAR